MRGTLGMSGPELAPSRLGEKYNLNTEVMKPIKSLYHKEYLVKETHHDLDIWIIFSPFALHQSM